MVTQNYEELLNHPSSEAVDDLIRSKQELSALKQAYADLDAFIHTVAHEMKSPISEIELYAEFIEEDNAGMLLPQSVEDLCSIRSICKTMSALIQRLMEYSKANFKELEKKEIDTKILIHQCFEEITSSIPAHRITLEVGDLPMLYGDFFLVHLIFLNVISNSVKFTSNKSHPKICVSASYVTGGVEYCVKDNGIGFEQKYADHLFEPFERLQNESVFQGNGVGLTIVKRIAERIHGKVSINGIPNEGCEVRIWFPKTMLYNDNFVESAEKHTIRIGIIGDFTGKCPLNEQGKIAASKLAAEEINANGGINTLPVELFFRDDRGLQLLTEQAARELTEELHVDVLMGSTLSPSRDIIRSYANRNKTLYLDTQQTEGGVADHYTFCLSAMPEQQMTHMLQYLIRNYGKRCFIITSDYNFGILSAEWAKYLVIQLGGEVMGCEHLDDQISDFDFLIDRIQRIEIDVLISVCVFPNHNQFYLQWNARNLNKIPIASTMVAAETYQHIELPPGILENTYVMASFLEVLNTPAAKQFTKRFREKYGVEQVPFMGMDTETAYSSIYLYKKAVEQAGTTETEAVIAALESNSIFFDGPGGRVLVRGSDHHTSRRMSCFRIDAQNQIHEIFRTGAIHSDYVEAMIESTMGIKGGIKSLGINCPSTQYNMLLNKLHI